PDGLETELLERQVGELGRLAGPVEHETLHSGLGELTQRVSKSLSRAAVDVNRVRHVLIGQPTLLPEPLRREQITEALPGGRLLRNLDDLDRPFAGQALEQQVRQSEGHPQSLRQRPLTQGSTLPDGRQNLEVALGLPLDAGRSGTVVVHGLNVQYLNTPGARVSRKRDRPGENAREVGRLPAVTVPYNRLRYVGWRRVHDRGPRKRARAQNRIARAPYLLQRAPDPDADRPQG